MGAALRHEELLAPIKLGVEKICDKTELTDASTGFKTTQLGPKFSLRRALLLGVTTVLMPLSFVQTAHAQETTPISVGQMLVPGGVQLPLGITAEAEVFYVGTGIMAAGNVRHGETGMNPLDAGGELTTGDTGFAESLFPLGAVEDATGILADGQEFVDNGTATDYADALGFKITFSQPLPISYFYGLDIDAARDEWQTAFGYDNSGNFFAPDFSTQPGGDELSLRTGINPSGWGLSLPSGGIELVYKSGNNNGITPATQENQVLYDFKDEPLKEIYFLFGLERLSTTNSASNANASALSALFVPNPEMDVTKTATVGALQADNTFDITYDLLIENTGGIAFESFSLTDDLAAASNLGSAFNNITPAGVTFTPVVSAGGSNFPAPNPAFDGNGASGNAELIDPADTVLFQPGDSFTLTFTANVDAGPSEVTLPNSATASAQPVGFTGSTLVENSDDDTDETNGNNPTLITAPVAALPELTVTKTTGTVGALQANGSFTQEFSIEVENTGTTIVTNPTLVDDLEDIFGPAFEPSNATVAASGVISAPVVTADAGNTGTSPTANSNYDGDAVDNLFDGASGSLSPNDKIIVTFTALFRAHAMPGDVTNTVTAGGTLPVGSTLTPVTGTSLVAMPALPSPRPSLLPATCGTYIAEGFLTDPLPTEPAVVFGEGTTNDPYVQQYMTRNATTGEISIYYPTANVSLSGSDITTDFTSELTTTPPGGSGQQSELWRVAIKVNGTGGTSETIRVMTENVHEFTSWWVTDTSGVSIANNDWVYTTSTVDGVNFNASFTYPANGIAYLNIVMTDPVNLHGEYTITAADYTCPPPALDAVKSVEVCGDTGAASYAIPGSDVIYSITVTNSGVGDADSIELIDNMPPEISFWNGDIDFGGPDNFTDTTPVALEQSAGASLTFDYNTDVRFGFGATAPADFDSCTALAPDNTYRDDVTFICFNPKGALNGGDPAPNFSVNFRARID